MQVIHWRESHRILLRKWRCDSGKRWWPIKEHCYLSVNSEWLESNNQKAMLANPGLLRVVPFTPLPRELGSSLKSSHESSIVAPCGLMRSSERAACSAGTGSLLEVGRRPCWKPSWSWLLWLKTSSLEVVCRTDLSFHLGSTPETLWFRVSYLVSVNLNSLFLFPMEYKYWLVGLLCTLNKNILKEGSVLSLRANRQLFAELCLLSLLFNVMSL